MLVPVPPGSATDSMLRAMADQPTAQRTTFLIGARTPGHLFALDELRQLGEKLQGMELQVAVEQDADAGCHAGYATDLSEESEGCHCGGIVVRGPDRTPVAALWVTGMAKRLADESLLICVRHLQVVAAQIEDALAKGVLGDLGEDLVDAILQEAGRFATAEVAPLAEIGDRQGAKLADGKVTTPDGWADLYRRWAEAGWNSLTAPEEFGGQNLPHPR